MVFHFYGDDTEIYIHSKPDNNVAVAFLSGYGHWFTPLRKAGS